MLKINTRDEENALNIFSFSPTSLCVCLSLGPKNSGFFSKHYNVFFLQAVFQLLIKIKLKSAKYLSLVFTRTDILTSKIKIFCPFMLKITIKSLYTIICLKFSHLIQAILESAKTTRLNKISGHCIFYAYLKYLSCIRNLPTVQQVI